MGGDLLTQSGSKYKIITYNCEIQNKCTSFLEFFFLWLYLLVTIRIILSVNMQSHPIKSDFMARLLMSLCGLFCPEVESFTNGLHSLPIQ